ncbi:M20 family metallopeptidase [Fervidobacterium riparium]|uniref:N-acetyldiaminopimelate deacetylase n=1 Tax=Fervidobacterium gondwanense DSM 13020 TaxID=1121883 RepID=A0A1M7SDN3_FERGO|nr:M20 family metallopeptidase [Fervidobacterium gondwanense]UXF01200.1 amidohydrolase [Fervidobacterium riparium]SHN56588.1 N-acetyldiaminopimelate deacetylase [Fervidobacterium gondwanense DSM 13020]
MLSPIELRHELHMSPELAFNEYNTQKILSEALKELGVEFHPIAKTGLAVLIQREPTAPSVLYRADMDALPIKEETRWEYCSRNEGLMHACGHDIHMSVMYGVIKKITEDDIPGNYVFIYQPAEETIGGAKYVLDEMRERYKVKYATALHVTDEYRLGEFASTNGTLFACAMEITAKFKGLSAHIAQKEKGIDAIKNAVAFTSEFYQNPIDNNEKGRRVLAGFGKMFGGNVRNAVADYAQVEGSIRGETLEIVIENFERLKVLAEKYSGTLERGSLYPPVINNEKLFELFKDYASNNGTFIDCGMKYTGEDFGFFTMKYPSLMFWAGVRTSEEVWGLHNPKFLPDDCVIPHLVDFMVEWLMLLSNNV